RSSPHAGPSDKAPLSSSFSSAQKRRLAGLAPFYPGALSRRMAPFITGVLKAITVMDSHERNLSNQRLFNVGVTRVRDDLTMVVDDKAKLERQLDHNPGNKTSALETLGRLEIDGPGRAQASGPFDPGPVEGGPGPKAADGLDGLPPVPPAEGQVAARTKSDDLSAPRLKPEQADLLPPLPERSLGLDL
ncbi:hypothetical protein AB4Z00_26605, partial [Novosphingobium sp. YAF33]